MRPTSPLVSLLYVGGVMADTLRVNTFSDVVCSGLTHSFQLGELNKCHQVPDGFRSLTTSEVAQSFFGRNIKVRVWSTNDCQHSSITEINTFQLSNAGGNCHVPFADVNEGQQNPFKGFSFDLVQQ